jgi:tetratricopeptide (TPR) repeat protein
VASLTAKINKANATSKKVGALPSDGEDQRSNLEKVARLYGLKTEDLDEAIRSWGARTTDPYDVGLAALYERDYPRATGELKEALKTREAKLAQDQKAVVNAAFVLGKSFYKQGKYRDAVTAYERCLQLSPGDTTVVNNLAVSLHDSGDFARAEPLYRRALAIDEKALGPEHPDVAISLNNLASLSKDKGDYAGAEPLLRRALAIDEKALGPEHPNVAAGLNNLGLLLGRTGDYAGAEPLLRRALAIDEKALGPEHPDVAIDLSNLVSLLQGKGDYAGAEPLLRRALAIQERRLGLDNPTTIKIRNNLEALHRLDAQAKKK